MASRSRPYLFGPPACLLRWPHGLFRFSTTIQRPMYHQVQKPTRFAVSFAHFPKLKTYALHCFAIASAMPGNVRLRSFHLSGPGGSFQLRCSRPCTMFVYCSFGRFLAKDKSFSFRHAQTDRAEYIATACKFGWKL